MTTAEVAKLLGVSHRRVRAKVHQLQLRGLKAGRFITPRLFLVSPEGLELIKQPLPSGRRS
jgi:excisionase family DNA binding protein